MWSRLSSDKRFVLRRVLRYCAVVVVAAYPISQTSTWISAMVVKADFLGSWVQVINDLKPKDRTTFRMHVVNQGNMESGEAAITVIFPDGWKYAASHCPIGMVTTRERGYGNELVWNLPSLAVDQAVECDLDFSRTVKTVNSVRFLFSVAGKNARAVYREMEWQGNDSFNMQLFFELKTWLKNFELWMQAVWNQFIHSISNG